jgi:hypothetical protein
VATSYRLIRLGSRSARPPAGCRTAYAEPISFRPQAVTPTVGRIRQTLRDLLPSVAAALSPPDRENTDWEALGATSDEIRQFALNGLTRRLNIVGVPLNTL